METGVLQDQGPRTDLMQLHQGAVHKLLLMLVGIQVQASIVLDLQYYDSSHRRHRTKVVSMATQMELLSS